MAGGETIVSGMAGRYANALFELARDDGTVDKVLTELTDFAGLLDSSADLRRLVASPVFSADEQARAIAAVLERVKVKGLTANFLALVARNRRLFAVRDMITAFKALVAADRGEVSAAVVSATPLNAGHVKSLKAAIKAALGNDVQIDATVDEGLIGGLIIKVGSRQIDTSLRTKLNNLKIALKEVG